MTNHIGFQPGTTVRHTATHAPGTVLDTKEMTGAGDLDGTWHLIRFDDLLEEIWCHEASLEIRWTNRPNAAAMCD